MCNGTTSIKNLPEAPACPKLKSYWHFHGCRYTKLGRTCAEPDHISALSAADP